MRESESMAIREIRESKSFNGKKDGGEKAVIKKWGQIKL